MDGGLKTKPNRVGRNILVLLAVVVCVSGGTVFGQPWDGNGVEGDPYLIWDANDMQALGANGSYWGKHFRLMADINLSAYTGTSFNITGAEAEPFSGVFDGNGHTIANFTYDSNDVNYVGLFGYVSNGRIMNLGLRDPNVNGGTGDYVGSLVGFFGGRYSSVGALISNSYSVDGSVSGSGQYIGGLVGLSIGATVSSCYSSTAVSGGDSVGGLVGDNAPEYKVAGGIENCYSTGNISGNVDVGGLVGRNGSRVQNCYSGGSVAGAAEEGGLIGNTYSGITTGSFWDVNTSGQISSDGGTGKTTEEMQSASTFVGWGCEPVWRIDEGNDYPHLIWENTSGVVITSPSYGGGSGSLEDPYLIYTGEQLNTIGLIDCHLDKHFRLMADIDLGGFGGSAFNLIGSQARAFSGRFDGNGYEIYNFGYTSTDVNYVGLFRVVSGGSGIVDLGLIDANVQAGTGDFVGLLVGSLGSSGVSGCYVRGGNVAGETYVGGLVGYDSYGTLSNCDVEANVSGSVRVGGLAGLQNGRSISACHFLGSIEGGEEVGGLAGYGTHTNIMECYVDGIISGTTSVGGLVGRSSWCYIKDCYNMSVVEGVEDIGGLVGYAVFENSVLEHCYAVGNVSGDVSCGGLVGGSSTAIVSDCYWDVETTGQLLSSGGGIGKATVEMQDVGTYIGWGCESRWTIDDGNDYPRFAWQNEPGISIAGGAPWAGSGTESEPYRIYTAEQFDSIGLFECEWDKHFKLMADVDIGRYIGAQFNVIGHPRNTFDGGFDGNSKRILNFTYDVPGRGYAGIFGSVGNDTEIRDITIVNPDINIDGYYTGALIGRIGGNNSIVRNCHVINGVIAGGSKTGGLIGEAHYGHNLLISQCSTTCDVYGWGYVGGLVGYFSDGTISECATMGNVTGGYTGIGGLLGSASNPATIENSYARGDVAGINSVAGLIGDVWDYWYAVNINKCYSTGMVQGGSLVGGLVNEMYRPSNVTDSFWDVETSGTSYSGGGTGKTTARMQTKSTFTWAGWDFVDIWDICEGTNYPKLVWQIPEADFVCPDGVDFIDYGFFADHWLETDYGDVNGVELSGDGKVNWEDFALFAEWWRVSGCGVCGGADFTGEEDVDELDLDVFSRYWLESEYGDCGGAELTGDGTVGLDDLGRFSASWLAGL